MKLKLTRPDGSVLEVDGTVEECSAVAGLASINVTGSAPIEHHYHYHYHTDWGDFSLGPITNPSAPVSPLVPWTPIPTAPFSPVYPLGTMPPWGTTTCHGTATEGLPAERPLVGGQAE